MRKMLPFIFLSFQLITTVFSSISAEVAVDFEDVRIIIIDDKDLHQYQDTVLTTIKFFFFPPSEDKNNTPIALTPNNSHLLNTNQPTKILIHGIGTFHDQIWIDQMVSRYHSKGNYNIIAVDWSAITTKDSIYIASVVNDVGKVVGNFLIEVTQQSFEFLKSVHLIGASIGAQVGGIAGEHVGQKGKGKIDRITGLDPEEPTNLGYLDKSDADFVDVIHSNWYDEVVEIGTVDFYLTGKNKSKDHDYTNETDELTAAEIFMLSIDDEGKFKAVVCSNITSYDEDICDNTTVVVGEWVPRNVSGTFYVTKGSATNLSSQKYVLFLTILTITFSLFITN